jgi:murein hydrolase activator
MIKIFTINVCLIVLFISVIQAQEQEQISRTRNELNRIKTEIQQLESELKSASSKEKESFQAVNNFNKQSFLLSKLINEIKKEEGAREREIQSLKGKIEKLEKDAGELKRNYAQYVISIYKHGKVDELSAVLNAKSIVQAVHRYKYFQKFSEKRERDLVKLKQTMESLADARVKIELERREKLALANEKEREERELSRKIDEKKRLLAQVRSDKSGLQKEIQLKRDAEGKIKNLISKLIEEAERKKREEAERIARLEKERIEKLKRENRANATSPPVKAEEKIVVKEEEAPSYTVDLTTAGLASFTALRGKMAWPVSGGKIIRKFGEHKNELLNTVTLNYGVDIQVVSDYSVRSVADGIISAIEWIPGYGSVIIITHKEDYRTVYSHLSEIYVKEGDRVRMGSVIAKVGESIEGNLLHFQIWNSRSNQNPEIWLAKK